MKKDKSYLDKRGDLTAPPAGTAEYPKKPKNQPISSSNKEDGKH